MRESSQHVAAAQALRSDPEVKARLRNFLATDNLTNFAYIFRAYLVAGLSIAGAVMFFEFRGEWGIAFLWSIPVYLTALAAVGASQHQLAGAVHEAVHNTLFKNRMLNELAGDFLCAFPILTSVSQFRLYHLAHHQYVNDPERDPDFALLEESGHWMKFPVAAKQFLGMMLRQLLVIDLLRYIVVRARYNTLGTDAASPYGVRDGKARRIPARGSLVLFAVVVGSSIVIQKWGEAWMVLAVPIGTWLLFSIVLLRLGDDSFEKAKIKPVIHPRFVFIGQTGCFALLVAALAFAQMTTGFMALRYFSMLWYGAILTTFPFFLIMRQVIQHGNGDRSWLANTRVFRMSLPVRYAIFPFGMDYHLPHHMYATIPHYRLKEFHEFMMTRDEYREHCQLVDNYLLPVGDEARNPTVLEVLGPEYSIANRELVMDDAASKTGAWTG